MIGRTGKKTSCPPVQEDHKETLLYRKQNLASSRKKMNMGVLTGCTCLTSWENLCGRQWTGSQSRKGSTVASSCSLQLCCTYIVPLFQQTWYCSIVCAYWCTKYWCRCNEPLTQRAKTVWHAVKLSHTVTMKVLNKDFSSIHPSLSYWAHVHS